MTAHAAGCEPQKEETKMATTFLQDMPPGSRPGVPSDETEKEALKREAAFAAREAAREARAAREAAQDESNTLDPIFDAEAISVARVALEFWRGSGERTLERLRSLCAHFEFVYVIPEGKVYVGARALVQSWEVRP